MFFNLYEFLLSKHLLCYALCFIWMWVKCGQKVRILSAFCNYGDYCSLSLSFSPSSWVGPNKFTASQLNHEEASTSNNDDN